MTIKEHRTSPPTYRTTIEQVQSRTKDGTPWIQTVEIVTEGDEHYGNAPDVPPKWTDLPDDEKAVWVQWLSDDHDFDVRLAECDPEIVAAYTDHPDRENVESGEWLDRHVRLNQLLDQVIKEHKAAAE